jgi:glyoxylase-like metal-dependent hydrolase (beta-lactamase superfamily II)
VDIVPAVSTAQTRGEMNALEHQLEYPFGNDLPSGGELLEVADDVFWLRMPLPFALDHINLWLLRDEIDGRQGWSVVDCGVATATTKAFWERLFTTALEGLPVLRILVTHCHPDHLGLAQWLVAGGDNARWNASLWITQGEYLFGRTLLGGANSNVAGPGAALHFARNGLDDEGLLRQIRDRTSYYPELVPVIPPSYRRISDGDVISIGRRMWEVVTGFGHSPEHAALHCAADALLISGDMILPRISTNVSVFDMEPEADPLALYLASLERYAGMPEKSLVLPAHGKPFRGLQTRIKQLKDHHAARLDETFAACCQSARTAAELVPILFKRELDAHQAAFAMGEAIAHLHMLWRSGKLDRFMDEQGRYRFTARQACESRTDHILTLTGAGVTVPMV